MKPILPPGPELEAIVAGFMGYKVEPLSEWPEYWPGVEDRKTLIRVVSTVANPEDGCEMIEDPGPDIVPPEVKRLWRPWRIPKYSREIGEAWKVLEKICERDQSAMVGLREVWLFQDQMGPHEVIHGQTAAHAIALAAKWFLDNPNVKTIDDLRARRRAVLRREKT